MLVDEVNNRCNDGTCSGNYNAARIDTTLGKDNWNGLVELASTTVEKCYACSNICPYGPGCQTSPPANTVVVTAGVSCSCGGACYNCVTGATWSGSACVDSTAPSVTTFSATAVSSNVNISYAVADTGGSHINDVEIWRAPDVSGSPGTYVEIPALRQTITSQNWDNYSNSTLVDTPGNGTWWYGVHVVDQASNVGTETTAQRQKVTILVCSSHTFPGITDIRDSYIAKQGPTTNNGSGIWMLTQAMAGGPWQRAIISFNVPGYSPADVSKITSATLTLYYAGRLCLGSCSDDPAGTTIQVYQLKTPTVYRDFTESSVTWNTYDGTHAWSAGTGGDFIATDPHGDAIIPPLPTAGTVPMNFDITSIVKDAITNHGGIVNLLIKAGIESPSGGKNYVPLWDAKEVGSNIPTLTVNYQTCP